MVSWMDTYWWVPRLAAALVALIVARDGVLLGGSLVYRAYILRWQVWIFLLSILDLQFVRIKIDHRLCF